MPTVTHTIEAIDGTARAGVVAVIGTVPAGVWHTSNDRAFGTITATSDANGLFTVTLPANTDLEPTGSSYRIDVPGDDPLYFAVPAGGGTVRDLLVDPPGTVDSSGLALHVLAADPHTGYLRESVLTAKGDLYAATAAGTVTRLPVGSNDQVLTADSAQATGLKWAAGGGGGTLFVRRTADSAPIQSDQTLNDDDTLVRPVEANAVYELFALIHYNSGAAADFRLGFTAPAGSVLRWVPASLIATAGGQASSINLSSLTLANDVIIGGAGADAAVPAVGLLVVGGTPGDFRVQWAQGSSTAADTKVLANSFLRLQKVA